MNLEKVKEDYKTGNYDIVMRDINLGNWVINNNPTFFEGVDNTIEYKSINKKDRFFLDKYLENKDFLFEVEYARDNGKCFRLGKEFIHNYNEDNVYMMIDNPLINKVFKITDEIQDFLLDDMDLEYFTSEKDDEKDNLEYFILWYYDMDNKKIKNPYFTKATEEDIKLLGFEELNEKDFIKNMEIEF